MSGILATLRRARSVLSDPKQWTQGTLAKAADGHRVPPDSPEAVCWCAVGALRIGGDDGHTPGALTALNLAAAGLFGHSPSEGDSESIPPAAWTNDVRGYAATLRMYDVAIAKFETAA